MKKLQAMTVVSVISMLAGCEAEPVDTEYCVLPVAAQVQDGGEVLVGTFDESTRELTLVPAFIDELQRQVEGGRLQLVRGEVGVPVSRELEVEWTEGLAVGDILRVVPQGENPLGVRLVVHDEGWIDGLTEAEAASAFPACWDPEPCESWDPACTCLTIIDCGAQVS